MKNKIKVMCVSTLTATLLGGCIRQVPPTPGPEVKAGFVQLKSWFTQKDTKKNRVYSSNENNEILVIPMDFSTSSRGSFDERYFREWTNEEISDLKNYFTSTTAFKYDGKTDVTVQTYFKKASNSKAQLSFTLASTYLEENITLYSIEGGNKDNMFKLFANALKNAEETYTGSDFKARFDKNNDGYIDNVVFVSNFLSGGTSLMWPSRWSTYREPAKDNNHLNVSEYIVFNTPYLRSNSMLGIHELSHCFGIQDYYNVASNGDASKADYFGNFDMQSTNKGDWNAFSKFSVGWGNPYVIDGERDEVTLTIKSSQENGDYIVIPANYSTWNKTPFDEYFMIELLNNTNNNEGFLKEQINKADTTTLDYGARLIHVYAPMSFVDFSKAYVKNKQALYKEEFTVSSLEDVEKANKYIADNDIKEKWDINIGANNSTVPSSAFLVEGYQNYPTLSVIQNGGMNTLGRDSDKYRHTLSHKDLFYSGNSFSFEDYATFYKKDCSMSEKTVKDEIFPYTILFDSVSKDSLTVTIKK